MPPHAVPQTTPTDGTDTVTTGSATPLVGSPLPRTEDAALVAGRGMFVDDVEPPDTLHVAMVRSPVAHATIVDLELPAMPDGVTAVVAADIEPARGTHLITDLPAFPLLADTTVRYQGHPVAAVLAPDRHLARDVADAIWVEYDELPAAVDPVTAIEDGSPLVFGETDSNVTVRATLDCEGDVFEGADVIVERTLVNHRVAPATLEPRSVLAVPQEDGRVIVYCSHQMPHRLRSMIASSLEIAEDRIRVIAPDVGGGFGAKGGTFYPEYPIVTLMALRLGRPVKYVETRTESTAVTAHGRAHHTTVALGATKDGTMTGLRVRTIADFGAATFNASLCLNSTRLMAPGCYDIPRIEGEFLGVMTHTPPVGAFRGAGRPEATFVIERIIDALASELAMDPAELRRRNFVPADAFPFTTPTGATYDSGDYVGTLDAALAHADYRSLIEQRDASPADRPMGVGVASYVEITARGGEFGRVEMDETGAVIVRTGTAPHGQGHETTWAQLAADELGVPMTAITVVHSDTDLVERGWGTAASRSAALGGTAVRLSAEQVAGRLRQLAADRLEADPDDIVLRDSLASVRGTDVAVAIADLAAEAAGLGHETDYEGGGAAFPFGTHVCAVEIDTSTGRISILRYVAVDDVGRVINPLITQGQIEGGIGHGATHALFEEVRFDDAGNLETGNWATYHVPTMSEMVDVEALRTETPSPNNPLGVKGVGEPGTTGATPAIANAVLDALGRCGVPDDAISMPFTADVVWTAIQEANR